VYLRSVLRGPAFCCACERRIRWFCGARSLILGRPLIEVVWIIFYKHTTIIQIGASIRQRHYSRRVLALPSSAPAMHKGWPPRFCKVSMSFCQTACCAQVVKPWGPPTRTRERARLQHCGRIGLPPFRVLIAVFGTHQIDPPSDCDSQK